MTNRFITLKDADGIWKLSLGDSVRDRKLIEPAPKVESPAEVPTDKPAETSAVEPVTERPKEQPETAAAKIGTMPTDSETAPAEKPAEAETATEEAAAGSLQVPPST